jgi:hypothetical protein
MNNNPDLFLNPSKMNEISQYFSQVKPKLEVLYNKSVILDNTISKIEELIAENTKLKNEKDNDEKLLKILAIKYKKSKLENKECTECKNKDNIIEFKNKEYIDIKNKIISKSQENKPCNECIKKDKIVTELKENKLCNEFIKKDKMVSDLQYKIVTELKENKVCNECIKKDKIVSDLQYKITDIKKFDCKECTKKENFITKLVDKECINCEKKELIIKEILVKPCSMCEKKDIENIKLAKQLDIFQQMLLDEKKRVELLQNQLSKLQELEIKKKKNIYNKKYLKLMQQSEVNTNQENNIINQDKNIFNELYNQIDNFINK